MISCDVFILNRNHKFDRTEIQINDYGYYESKQTVIEDEVWIGLRIMIISGCIVKNGTIVGMGSVLTKDFLEYCIVGEGSGKID